MGKRVGYAVGARRRFDGAIVRRVAVVARASKYDGVGKGAGAAECARRARRQFAALEARAVALTAPAAVAEAVSASESGE